MYPSDTEHAILCPRVTGAYTPPAEAVLPTAHAPPWTLMHSSLSLSLEYGVNVCVCVCACVFVCVCESKVTRYVANAQWTRIDDMLSYPLALSFCEG